MKFSWFPAVVILGLLAAWSAGQDATPVPKLPPPHVVEEFDISRDGDAVLVPVTCKGRKLLCLLDTGMPVNMFSRDVLPEPDKPVGECRYTNWAGPVTIPTYRSPEATVGGLPLLPDSPTGTMDFAEFRKVLGKDVRGILGMPFLHHHTVRIDFDAGKVSFLTWAGDEAGELGLLRWEGLRPYLKWDPNSLDQERHRLWVRRVEIGGQPAKKLYLSSGYLGHNCGALTKDYFESLIQTKKLQVSGRCLNWRGEVTGRVGRAEDIVVGNACITNPVFAETPVNTLGMGFLSRFVVTFDFLRSAIYLKKGKRFEEPFHRSEHGLALDSENGRTVVRRVYEGSPAARSGLQQGDVVLELAGRSSADTSLLTMARLLSIADSPIRVRVQRGDQELDVNLVLNR